MADTVSDLARRLAENAEAVCRYYLFNGRRQGGYWLVGDVHNAPGRSLYVRLQGPNSGKGAAGKWTDAADGGHGDLLDLIGAVRGLQGGDLLDEAHRFLGLVRTQPEPPPPATAGSAEAARRLFAMGRPIGGTLADTYLRGRGITDLGEANALRFHARCWYRSDPGAPDGMRDTWPALLAAVTDEDDRITGLQRTYLDPSGRTKAPVATPRRAMGHLLGNAVRLGSPGDGVVRDVMAAGEGIETVLSLRCALPCLPLAAALSAGHFAALLFPPGLRRLYLIRDNDPAGHWAAEKLMARAQAAGIETLVLAPTSGDWNDDLLELGPDAVATALRLQLAPDDVTRFLRKPGRGGRIR
ncbi:DUF7146 domain-containing protein [Novosphingopyxis sp.]|uniref:DUF7146 domain-containing protein n=1 Tax=Novosphingopyxis sp. TaxID=2709690 RepID=UPI003B5930C8